MYIGNEGSIDSSIRNIADFITVVDKIDRFGSKLSFILEDLVLFPLLPPQNWVSPLPCTTKN